MFAELERRVAEKRAAGIDVISLGIGDPDQPTYPHIVAAMQEAVADPATRAIRATAGEASFAGPLPSSTSGASGFEIDPETEVIPAIGAKECIYNLCFAFLDPGDVALASDPGYPGLHRRPDPRRGNCRAAAPAARARLCPRPERGARPRPQPGRG